jgi:DHA1 family bicyclomycin/chloramphenicol resistance-like MFS transporter
MTATAAIRSLPPIWVLALAVSGANVGISLLSPAIPALRADLMATGDQAQLVLGVFLVMLGLGQLAAGSISDRIGRRPVLVYGALLFTLGGLGSLFSTTVEMLIAMRLIQGLGAAACTAMGRVIISDSFDRAEAGKQLSTITMFQAIVPLLGFAFGGILVDFVGWRGSVTLMVITSAVVLVSSHFLVSESRTEKGAPLPIRKIMGIYAQLLVTQKFIANASGAALMTAVFFAMGGFMPYHFKSLGASAFEFGLSFSITSVGYMAGNSINRSLGPRMGLDRAAFTGSLISVVAMSGLTVAGYTETAVQPVVSGFLFFYGLSNGLVIANTIIGAVRAAGPHSGAATGLCGALQMGVSAVLGSLIIAFGGDSNFKLAISICWLMSAFGVASAFLALERAPRR